MSGTIVNTLTPTQADLVITKTDGSGTYLPGSQITYTISVSNPTGPSAAMGATVTDTIPTAITNPTWTATYVGGANGPASGAGNLSATVNLPVGGVATFKVTGTVALSATGDVVNTASVTPPTGITDPNSGNNSATDTNVNGGVPQLSIQKQATPGTFAVGQPGQYAIQVSNAAGTSSTTGVITVTDSVPAGLTAGAPTGAGWDCSASTATQITCTYAGTLLPGANAPDIIIPVTVSAGAAGVLTNTAQVTGGGSSCTTTQPCEDTLQTGVNTPQLDVTKILLNGPLVVNVLSQYLITVTNTGQAATVAGGTVTDTIPTGLLIGTLPTGCSVATGQTVVCAIPAGLGTGQSVTYQIPVTPQSSASGSAVTNTATASGGGDPTCPLGREECTGVTTDVVDAPELALTKTSDPETFVVGQPASYTLTVANVGSAATTAVATVVDTLPSGLTIGSPLPGACTVSGQTVTCTVFQGLPAGSALGFTIPVVATVALNNLSVANAATVTGGGDPGCPTGASTATLSDQCQAITVTPVGAPQLTLTKSASPTGFVVGQPGSYILTVQNTGSIATTAPATITDIIPSVFTLGALPSGCTAAGQQVACTVPANLAPGATRAFTLSVTPLPAAAGENYVNVATVTGGGDPVCPFADNCSSQVEIVVTAPALRIVKTANPEPFIAGQSGSYTLTVTNVGSAATTGTITVTDTLPASVAPVLPVSGCAFGDGRLICASDTSLAVGNSLTFSVPVNILAGTGGASVTNTATVAGGGDPSCPSATNPNCASSIVTVVVIDPNTQADLSINKQLQTAGPYTVGQTLTYLLTVHNDGPGAATQVKVSDTPTNLTIRTVSGACTTLPCTLASLGAGQTVTITVNATINAAGAFDNAATVTGLETDPDPTDNTDATNNGGSTLPINPSVTQADLLLLKSSEPNPYVVGQTLTYSVLVRNNGPSDVIGATVTETLPAAFAGFQWSCSATPGSHCTAQGTGNLNDTVTLLAGGSLSYTITGTVPANTTGIQSNRATVSPPVTVTDPVLTNNTGTDTNPSSARADLAIVKSSAPDPYLAGQRLTYTLQVSNNGPSDAVGATVADLLPAAFGAFRWTCSASVGSRCSASGTGNIQDTVDITAHGRLTYTLSGIIPVGTSGIHSNRATISPPATVSDPVLTNNTAINANPSTAHADITLEKTAQPNPYTAGQALTYTLILHNAGPSDVRGAQLSDPLPTPFQHFSWRCSASTGSRCTASGQGDLTDTMDLAVNGTLTYTLTGTVPAGVTGSQRNTATVTLPPGLTDPTPANNTSTAAIADRTTPPATVDGDALFFPYFVVSDTVTAIVSVINRAPGDPTGSTPQYLHYQYFYKNGAHADDLAAPCEEVDVVRPTSANDLITFDLGGRYGNDQGILHEPDHTRNADYQGKNFAVLNGLQPARGFLIVDNRRPPNQPFEGSLAGEMRLLDFAQGASWGYSGYNAAPAETLLNDVSALDPLYVFEDASETEGQILAGDRALRPDQLLGGNSPPVPVALAPLVTATHPDGLYTRFFVTPVGHAVTFPANAIANGIVRGNQRLLAPRQQARPDLRTQIALQIDRAGPGGVLFDRDENPISGQQPQAVTCIGAIDAGQLLSEGALQLLQASGGWGGLIVQAPGPLATLDLRTTPPTATRTANTNQATVIKLEYNPPDRFPALEGDSQPFPGVFNNAFWLHRGIRESIQAPPGQPRLWLRAVPLSQSNPLNDK